MKILIPVDGSEFGRRALERLAGLDDWLSPRHRHTLLFVAAPLPMRAAAAAGHDALQRWRDDEAEAAFAPLRPLFAARGLDVECRSASGPAADVIAATAADGGYDLIVIGSHGHGALAGLVLGSVSAKVLAKTSVPVLLVR